MGPPRPAGSLSVRCGSCLASFPHVVGGQHAPHHQTPRLSGRYTRIDMIAAMYVQTFLPGMLVIEHSFEIPLDHGAPGGERITVFARELAAPDGRERPFLVYLQGGPGYEAVRPTRKPDSPAWITRALEDYRVLLLDQRGTGRSSPIGTLPGLSPGQQADFLACFRADA